MTKKRDEGISRADWVSTANVDRSLKTASTGNLGRVTAKPTTPQQSPGNAKPADGQQQNSDGTKDQGKADGGN